MGFKEGGVKRVFSDPEKGPGDGNLCVKGRFGWDFIDHPERIKTPLVRANGTFKEVSWEEALGQVVKEFEAIKDQEGPGAIAGVASGRLTNEEYYLFGKLFREALGTNQVYQGAERAYRGLTEGLAKTLGIAASTNSIQEIRKADCILVIGADPSETHPIVKNEIHGAIRKNKAQLIVVGSYDIGLSQSPQISPLLPPAILLLDKPGREAALLNGMIQTILKEGLEDKGFIAERTEGIEELREKQVEVKLEVQRAARAYAQSKRAMILIGSGLWSHLDQREVAIASSNLSLITGHMGKESCGILMLLEKCNSQGAIDMGVFSTGEEGLKKAEKGKLKALYLVGEDSLLTSEILGNLRFLVVQDLFMTEAAKRAHVVLPACAFVEKGGTFTNLERRVQRLNPLRSPQGQSKSDMEIFLQLLHLFECPVSGETPEAIFEEIRRCVPYYKDVQDGEQWPNALPYLYAEGFPTGKARLIPVDGKMFHSNQEEYSFQLIQRPSLFRSGLLSSKSDALKIVFEKPSLEINPEDAKRLGIEEGEVAQVSTQEGRSLRMKVNFSSRLTPGVITVPFPCSMINKEGTALIKMERLKRS
jgi:predicted molibdopterin-dependent oxidoreductase YjgC